MRHAVLAALHDPQKVPTTQVICFLPVGLRKHDVSLQTAADLEVHHSRLDNLYLGERKDHPATSSEELCLATHDVLAEVPRKNEKIVWIHCLRFGLRNDGNMGSRR